jgi:hypothetical protein
MLVQLWLTRQAVIQAAVNTQYQTLFGNDDANNLVCRKEVYVPVHLGDVVHVQHAHVVAGQF